MIKRLFFPDSFPLLDSKRQAHFILQSGEISFPLNPTQNIRFWSQTESKQRRSGETGGLVTGGVGFSLRGGLVLGPGGPPVCLRAC